MEVPAELISVATFSSLWLIVCALWTVVWLVWTGWTYWKRSRPIGFPLLMGAVGPLSWLLWVVYRARIAYDPQTGIAGMHRVSVLLTNLALFVGIGAAIGVLAAVFNRRLSVPPSLRK